MYFMPILLTLIAIVLFGSMGGIIAMVSMNIESERWKWIAVFVTMAIFIIAISFIANLAVEAWIIQLRG